MGYGNYIPTPLKAGPGTVCVNGSLREVLTAGASRHFVVGEGASLSLVLAALPGTPATFDIEIDIVGEGSRVEIAGAYVSGGSDEVVFNILMHHRCGRSYSNQVIRGLAGGASRVRFNGRIVVAPAAQQIEAYQENHNILLTDDARVETKPQLEIYADDVKCSHGATVGKLSEDERFYMRSRGIPDREAKVLQMISFLSPVLGRLPEEEAAMFEEAVRSLA